jgi:hypothetical protein
MPNLLIAVKTQEDLSTLLRLGRQGFLSRRSPLSIELPEEFAYAVLSPLTDRGIDFAVKAIGRRGELKPFELTTPEPNKSGQFSNKLFAAFGESKTKAEWGRDARCVVSENTLWRRLNEGWNIEAALTIPTRSTQPPTETQGKPSRKYSAFGEAKTIREWAKDPRCAVIEKTLRGRLGFGWEIEKAIATPPNVKKPRDRNQLETAFDETKTVREWAKDRRRKVPSKCFLNRIDSGWEIERALLEPSNQVCSRSPRVAPPCPKCGGRTICYGTRRTANPVYRTRFRPETPAIARRVECVKCFAVSTVYSPSPTEDVNGRAIETLKLTQTNSN